MSREDKNKNVDVTENTDLRDPEEMLSQTEVMETLTDPDSDLEEFDEGSWKEKTAEPERTAVSEVIDFLKDLVICMVTVLLITNFVVRPVQVKGSSMYPTLYDTNLGFSNIIGYRMNGIQRFDVAIIYLEEKDEYLVKRVIGLPGETVSYTDGQLYINGEAVAEDFLDAEYIAECEANGETFMTDVQPITLGEDEYYCLGDNRPHSTDSRYYGPFTKDEIRSKSVFIFWPLSHFGGKAW